MMTAKRIQTDPAEAFRSVLLDAGLMPGDVAPDGVLRRCPTTEKPQSKNGWHVLYLDPPAGAFGDWGTGLDKKWSPGGDSPPPAEMARIRKEMEKQKAERKRQEAERHRAKAVEAQRYLANLAPADDGNPYLGRKKVRPCAGLLVDGDALIVPVLNPDGNKPMSYQRIDQGSDKKFMPGAKAAGGYFAVKGGPGPILVAEGIATALSLHEATGLTVIVAFSATNMGAVASMVRDRYRDRQIIVCADNDAKTAEKVVRNPGIEDATKAARAVNGLVAVTESPGDFNDLHVSKGLEAVKAAVEAARPPESSDVQTDQGDDWPEPIALPDGAGSQTTIRPVTIGDFLSLTFPPRQNLLDPWLPRQGLVMVYAYRGIGKTFFALCVAYAVACGGHFLRWAAARPRGVLYVDGEMPATVMQERLAAIVQSGEAEPGAPFILLTPDLQQGGMPRIDTEEGQAAIESVLTPEIELIVVDNISTLAGAKENEADGWTPIQAWALRQRAAGRSVVFVHHAGKTGMQRGTSRREDVLDTVIQLKRPLAYIPSQGAVFEIHFEKARCLHGDDVAAIEAKLTADESGLMAWTTRTIEASTFDKVAECINAGMNQKETADVLGVHKATVSRHAAKAHAAGLLTAEGVRER